MVRALDLMLATLAVNPVLNEAYNKPSHRLCLACGHAVFCIASQHKARLHAAHAGSHKTVSKVSKQAGQVGQTYLWYMWQRPSQSSVHRAHTTWSTAHGNSSAVYRLVEAVYYIDSQKNKPDMTDNMLAYVSVLCAQIWLKNFMYLMC